MKRFISILILAIMAVLCVVPVALAETIFTYKEDYLIADGITRTHLKKFLGDGYLNINCITVDLTKPNVSFELLKSDSGSNSLSTVVNLAKENNAIAAINGDFFAWNSQDRSQGSSIGIEIDNGEMVSTPAHEKNMAMAGVTKDNTMVMGYLTSNILLTAANGNSMNVKHLNKYDDLTSINMYNSHFNGGKSLGSYNNIVEMVVKDNTVLEIRKNMDPMDIPKDAVVFATLSDHVDFIDNNFQVGDKIKLDLNISPDINKFQMAVGAGALLVENGSIPSKFSHNISGTHPRTALGVSQDQKKIFMVTVDGRQTASKGVSQTELAKIMQEIGSHYAVNLDGGGSTTMVSKDFYEDDVSVKNLPSDGGNRKVVNAVGVTSKKGNDIAGVIIKKEDFAITGIELPLNVTGHDIYFNRLEIPDRENISYSLSGVEGEIKNHIFYPKTSGTASITAHYGATSYTIDFPVHEFSKLTLSNRNIIMKKGATSSIWFHANSLNGFSKPISFSKVSLTKNSITEFNKDGKLVGKNLGSEIIGFEFLNSTAYAQVNVGDYPTYKSLKLPNDIEKNDPYNVPSTIEGNGFMINVSSISDNPTLINNLAQINFNSKYNRKSMMNVYLGDGLNKSIITDGTRVYQTGANDCFDYNNTTFMTIDTSKSLNWLWIRNVFYSTDKKNIVIFMDELNIKNDEYQILKDMLSEIFYKNGRNAFIFYSGTTSNVTIENGTRIISLSSPNSSIKNVDVKSMKFAEIIINENNISYQLKNLF